MCNPLVSIGASIIGGISQKKSANKAAAAAQEVGEFNAQIIERDIDLLQRQREIVNNNFLSTSQRKRDQFQDVQGSVIANYAYAGMDISQGTPLQVMRENARELDYELAADEFNNEVTNMQIDDAQEDARLSAELSRMEGGASAASLRAQGTKSLISSLGSAARTADTTGIFT